MPWKPPTTTPPPLSASTFHQQLADPSLPLGQRVSLYLEAQRRFRSQHIHEQHVLSATQLAKLFGSPSSTVTRWQFEKVPLAAAEVISFLTGAGCPEGEDIGGCMARRKRSAIAYADQVSLRSLVSPLRSMPPIDWLLRREADPALEVPKAVRR